MLATIMQVHHLMSVGYWWYRIYRQLSLQLLVTVDNNILWPFDPSVVS